MSVIKKITEELKSEATKIAIKTGVVESFDSDTGQPIDKEEALQRHSKEVEELKNEVKLEVAPDPVKRHRQTLAEQRYLLTPHRPIRLTPKRPKLHR